MDGVWREGGKEREGERGREAGKVREGGKEREQTRLTGQVVCGNGRLGNLCGWGHQNVTSVFFQTVRIDSNKLIMYKTNVHRMCI